MIAKIYIFLIGLAVFILDLNTPLGFAGGVPYVGMILVGWYYSSGRYNFRLGVISSILVILGYLFSPPQAEPWIVLTNRVYALFAIWITVILLKKIGEKNDIKNFTNALLLKNTQIGVIQWDNNMVCSQWNKAAENIFGYTEDQALGHNANTLILIEETLYQKSLFANAMLSKESDVHLISRVKTKDGDSVYCEWFNTPLINKKGKILGVASMVQDITERVTVEKSLRESEEKFRLAFESFPIGNIQINKDSIIETFNPAAESIFGYSADEVIGQNVSIIMPKRTGEKHDGYVNKHIETGQENIIGIGREVIGRRKTGEEFPLHLGVGKVTIDGEQKFIGSITDLTKIKNLELLLRRSQKMEAIGELTGGIAHDFNNLLGIIIGNIDLLKYKANDPEKVKAHADKVLSAANRGSDITRRLLNFSRQSSEASSPINLNKVLSSMEDFIDKSVSKNITVNYTLSDDIWRVELNPGDLEDAIINLALNARDAMPEGGEINLTTKNVFVDETFTQTLSDLTPGEYVELSFSDNGEGMPKELANLIFDPFFTTKDKDKGTGLGLAMVYSFIKRSAGVITVYTEEDLGTTFKMYFPKSMGEDIKEKSEPSDVETLPKGTENILIVDDEEDLGLIAKNILDRLGYQTFMAQNGEDALKIIKKQKIDLLFSDVVMPGTYNGVSLSEKAIQHSPELKVLLTSGFTGKMVHEGPAEKWVENILIKPYRDVELANAARNALDGEDG